MISSLLTPSLVMAILFIASAIYLTRPQIEEVAKIWSDLLQPLS
jgi:hypothetical protein